MNFKKTLLLLVQCTGINLGMLVVAAMIDLVLLSSFWLLSVACFAVSGIFSAVFCFSIATDKIEDAAKKKLAIKIVMLWLTVTCIVIFALIGPLSTSEYRLPVQAFAVSELGFAFFLWRFRLF